MPRKKKPSSVDTVRNVSEKKTKSKTKNPPIRTKGYKKSKANLRFYDQLNLNDSYVSLILGAAVVTAIGFIFIVFLFQDSFVRRNVPSTPSSQEVLNSSVTPADIETPPNMYIMQENETLWDVAVKFFGDGFRYIEIVEANNLENPDFVPPGTKIIIPNKE